MNKPLCHYYPWDINNTKAFLSHIREFKDHGASNFVITETLLRQLVNDPEKVTFLHKVCSDMEVNFNAVHSIFGPKFDLNTMDENERAIMLETHKKAIEISSQFGCKNYVLHVGAALYCYNHIPITTLREYALKTLEELLPCAMANNMVLAVENSFELPNSAKEVMGLINHFNNHPNIGACYDSGHANCMATAPGKSLDKYEPYFYTCWWENGVIPEDNALETMASQIVTCHLHDNTGYGDLHGMPLDGTINWKELVPKLKALPRLTEYQSEVCMADGKNWAGQLLAPVGGYSIKRLCDTFKFIGF
jgi:sugar phosphate isomerase/epimerase